jgi:hypothetical protein
VIHGKGALCVDSASPVSECAADGPACWHGSTTTCAGGYPTGSLACASGMSCLVQDGQAICQ